MTQLLSRPKPTLVRPLHVAVVDEELPFPTNSGKRIRTLNLLRRLARRHRITYVCHRNADPDEACTAARALQSYGIETHVVERAVPRKSGHMFYARLAANLFSPVPYSVATHRSAALTNAVRALAASGRVDLWQCEWTPYADILAACPGARSLIIAHNVESLIWQRYHETEANPLKRWYIKHQWQKYERFEARACSAASRVAAVSAEDAAIFRSRFGVPRIDVVENGVDTQTFTPNGASPEEGLILFLGSLDWRPNLDAVDLLLDRVFPEVRDQYPGARLEIVGRNPPDSLVRRVRGMGGVTLYANVADVRPHLARCSVMAVPLRIGGGSRLKILEALAMGVPVVSTAVGAEGLALQSGLHLATVDGVDAMAPAIAECFRRPEAAKCMAAEGRRVVLERYDWDALADKLEQVWLRCLEN
jgi:glycosyltransferase involved in cell wall biosynthesis